MIDLLIRGNPLFGEARAEQSTSRDHNTLVDGELVPDWNLIHHSPECFGNNRIHAFQKTSTKRSSKPRVHDVIFFRITPMIHVRLNNGTVLTKIPSIVLSLTTTGDKTAFIRFRSTDRKITWSNQLGIRKKLHSSGVCFSVIKRLTQQKANGPATAKHFFQIAPNCTFRGDTEVDRHRKRIWPNASKNTNIASPCGGHELSFAISTKVYFDRKVTQEIHRPIHRTNMKRISISSLNDDRSACCACFVDQLQSDEFADGETRTSCDGVQLSAVVHGASTIHKPHKARQSRLQHSALDPAHLGADIGRNLTFHLDEALTICIHDFVPSIGSRPVEIDNEARNGALQRSRQLATGDRFDGGDRSSFGRGAQLLHEASTSALL
mmetsp:Transcript_32968/g.82868  ORF Transcript_32968/g.82868 Transcript_32968/m.82868 type:complete len:379 (+) Transcript_32968:548-1684(+)